MRVIAALARVAAVCIMRGGGRGDVGEALGVFIFRVGVVVLDELVDVIGEALGLVLLRIVVLDVLMDVVGGA
ncbi:hypothetical protein B0T19DRAFT_433191 [Cercophora scortea]|uniref:Uncharacterized protein n=1 Tax=Cercophora scortea TaxID=314031 RepID=A0AAE0I7D0_9PEZI|nr:hypothetical protein B0T19DRAFT_433191 [Cercophora scortea]